MTDRFIKYLKNRRSFLVDIKTVLATNNLHATEMKSVIEQIELLDDIILHYINYVKDDSNEKRDTQ